jgi:Mg-chelatase subunit ChlD/uncharacterized protein YaaQ
MRHAEHGIDRRLLVGLALVAFLLAFVPVAVDAQGPGNRVLINAIDVSGFPQMRVGLSVESSDGFPVQGLGKDAIRLWEDDAERTVTLTTETVGAVFAFLIDTSGSMAAEGAGSPSTSRLQQVKDLLNDDAKGLVIRQTDPERRDLVSVIGFNSQVSPTINLTDDYGAARNLVQELTVRGGTRLYDALVTAIDSFDRTPRTERMRKVLLVFSDGDDTESVFRDTNEIARRANERGIRIHAISLGYYKGERTSGYVDALSGRTDDFLVDRDLRSLALATGGTFSRLSRDTIKRTTDDKTPDELVRFFQTIARQREQYVLSYRSKANTSGTHRLKVEAGGVLKDRDFTVSVSPLAVSIASPAPGAVLTGGRQATDASLQVRVQFAENRTRNLERVEFLIDGQPVGLRPGSVRDEAGGRVLEYLWPLGEATAGQHTIKARVSDELGLTFESMPVTVRIDIPTVEATTNWVGTNSAVFLAVSLATIILAVILVVTRGRPLTYAARTISDTMTTILQGFGGDKKQTQNPQDAGAYHGIPRAVLELVDGPLPGRRYELTQLRHNVGRSAQFADIVVESDMISRWHAELELKTDGYYIKDHNSKNLTFVDEIQLQPEEQRKLHHQAMVRMGPVRFRFLDAGASANLDETIFFGPRPTPKV